MSTIDTGSGDRKGELQLRYQHARLIGREHELATVTEWLAQEDVRLITLTGAAGVGKTLLAVAVAKQLRDVFARVTFVDLASVTNSAQFLSAIARACEVRESISDSLSEVLARALASCAWLLLLDNCEHLIDAVPQVSALLAGCPALKVLATSRTPLHLRWERVFPVPPLEVPQLRPLPPSEALARVPSVALFVQRAQSHHPSFALNEDNARSIAELCVGLDGLPLAIELAAAWMPQLGLRELIARLDQRLDLLVGGARDASKRHQTMRAAISWSYYLLSPEERWLFRRLAVFTGRWTLEAAEGICSGEGLEARDVLPLLRTLVDRSMVAAEETVDSRKRYHLLETVREYALEKLVEAGEEAHFRRCHRDWFLAWVEAGEPSFWGAGQRLWLEQLEDQFDNLWAALEWSRMTPEEGQAGLRLWTALRRFWDMRGHFTRGQAILKDLLILAPEATLTRALALVEASHISLRQGDPSTARLYVEESLRLSRDLESIEGIVFSIIGLGVVHEQEGNLAAADACWRESLELAREAQYRVGTYLALGWLGHSAIICGNAEDAMALLDESVALTRGQNDEWSTAYTLLMLSQAAHDLGDTMRATRALEEALLLFWGLRELQGAAECIERLGQIAWVQGVPLRAAQLFGAGAAMQTRIGARHWYLDPRLAQSMTDVAQSLGEKTYSSAWAAGKSLSPMEAIHLATSPAQASISRSIHSRATGASRSSLLTTRELEIVALIANGLTNRQIAERLVVSKRTVDAHVRHILDKLDLSSRTQVAVWASTSVVPASELRT